MEINTIILNYKDGRRDRHEINGNTVPIATIPQDVTSIDFQPERFEKTANSQGFYLLPCCVSGPLGHGGLVYFKERQNATSVLPIQTMPVYAVNNGDSAELAIVRGMPLDYELVVEVENNRYRMFPRFLLDGPRTEDIDVLFISLGRDECDYSSIARRYRTYQFERGACVPLKERMKNYPVLAECVRSIGLRIRMAWKSVPPPVLEQTDDNEPVIKVAITFERAEEILDEMYRHGIRHADICLVGWNKSGHDGRFPDLFPAEPLLGGNDGLRKLIKKARDYGYLISAHTNLYDSYTIAKRLDRNDWMQDRSGQPVKGGCWGGGQAYRLCPEKAARYAREDMKNLKEYGFRGTHYFDCFTLCSLTPCWAPEHVLSRTDAGKHCAKMMRLSRDEIGASASEGSLDYCIGDIDEVLYSVFTMKPADLELCDELVPFWHLVYHGTVLYNSFGESVNAMIKSNPEFGLKNAEYGGRPQGYFYAKFLSEGRNWMGDEDLTCEDDNALSRSVTALAKAAKEYEKNWGLQLEFMEKHEKISEGVYSVTYSDGTTLYFDYNTLKRHGN